MIVMNIAQNVVRKILKVIHVTLHNKCKLLQLKKTRCYDYTRHIVWNESYSSFVFISVNNSFNILIRKPEKTR